MGTLPDGPQECVFCKRVGSFYESDVHLPALWDADWAGGGICDACYDRGEPPQPAYVLGLFSHKVDEPIARIVAEFLSPEYAGYIRQCEWQRALLPWTIINIDADDHHNSWRWQVRASPRSSTTAGDDTDTATMADVTEASE